MAAIDRWLGYMWSHQTGLLYIGSIISVTEGMYSLVCGSYPCAMGSLAVQ